MPTSAFPLSNTAFVYGGTYSAPFSLAGRQAFQLSGTGSRVDFTATGTAANVWMYHQAGQTLSVSVDGGAEVSVDITALANNAYGSGTLFTGLADAAHVVSFRTTYVDQGTGAAGTGVEVTGAAPAVSAPAGYGTVYVVDSYKTTSIKSDGTGTYGGGSGQTPAYAADFANCALRFRATCTGLRIFAYSAGQKYVLHTDRANPVVVTAPNIGAATYGWVAIASGLDGAAEHEYQLSSTGSNLIVYQLAVVGGTLNPATLGARPRWGVYGDSIGQNFSASVDYLGFLYQLGLNRNTACFNRATSGRTVSAAFGTNSGETASVAATITSISPELDLCIVELGTNDKSSIGTTITIAQFQTSYYNMMKLLTDGTINTKFYCYSPLAQYATAGITAAILAAIGATGNGAGGVLSAAAQARCHYQDTTGWVLTPPSADFAADNIHPTDAGHLKIATQSAAALPGATPVAGPHLRILLCGVG